MTTPPDPRTLAGTPDASSPPRPGRTRPGLLARILLALVVAVLTLFTAEMLSRLFLVRPTQMGFAADRIAKPYTMFGAGRFDRTVNRLGYRGPVPETPKGDEFRVFVLGGSTVFLGDPSVPALLEKEFHEHGYERVRVYNWGVVAASSGMELARLVFEISELEPDLVVMYDGGNDITTPFLYDPRPGYPMNFVVYEANPLLRSDLRRYPTWALLAYGSNLARLIAPDYFPEKFLSLEALRKQARYGSPEWRREIARIYVGNLGKASRFSDGLGAEFMGFFQPTIYAKPKKSPEEHEILSKLDTFLAEQRAGDAELHTTQMRQLVREELTAAGPEARLVDLSGVFEDSPDWIFEDFIHVRREGNEKIAAAVYEHLIADPRIRAALASAEVSPPGDRTREDPTSTPPTSPGAPPAA